MQATACCISGILMVHDVSTPLCERHFIYSFSILLYISLFCVFCFYPVDCSAVKVEVGLGLQIGPSKIAGLGLFAAQSLPAKAVLLLASQEKLEFWWWSGGHAILRTKTGLKSRCVSNSRALLSLTFLECRQFGVVRVT